MRVIGQKNDRGAPNAPPPPACLWSKQNYDGALETVHIS